MLDRILSNVLGIFTDKATEKIAEKIGDTVGDRIAESLEPLDPIDLELPADVNVVPKGLFSFAEEDASFYLRLLPGPYREDPVGDDKLPESIHFWKTRIEEVDPGKTFSVGLIYGPSGCGKSSLVKAGLIPHLADNVTPVYIEATSVDTEERLMAALKTTCPDLAPKGSRSLRAALRRRQEIPTGRKVLLILDQFEQYLHRTPADKEMKLVDALRECDGEKLQCVILVRDDFITPVTRFFRDLGIGLSSDRNCAMVDLFGIRHAKRVLALFGRAYGALSNSGGITKEEDRFLNLAVSMLAEGDYVICVRLALFTATVKDKEWTPATLKSVGGETGVGVVFLEDSFSPKTAPLEHRQHKKAARNVLQALLPETEAFAEEATEPGTAIKGAMKARWELLERSGYAQRPEDFEQLLEILNARLRLITTTERVVTEAADDVETAPDSAEEQYYQLTHDYMIPALRKWLEPTGPLGRFGRWYRNHAGMVAPMSAVTLNSIMSLLCCSSGALFKPAVDAEGSAVLMAGVFMVLVAFVAFGITVASGLAAIRGRRIGLWGTTAMTALPCLAVVLIAMRSLGVAEGERPPELLATLGGFGVVYVLCCAMQLHALLITQD